MVLQTNGVRRVPHDVSLAAHRNVGSRERVASVIGGAALALYGLERRDLPGGFLAVLGAELIRRGATGHCFVYDALNVTTASDATHHGFHRDLAVGRAATLRASRAVKIERTVMVNRPAADLYAFWRNPTNVRRIVDFVESVETLGERRARWRARGPAGVTIEWDSEVINDIPNELIAWKSIGDADIPNAGSIHFRRAPHARGTEVRLIVEYEPPAGHLGAWIAKLMKENPDEQVQSALRRLRQVAESGDVLTTERQASGN
jgi:uncharacterized membrane protein